MLAETSITNPTLPQYIGKRIKHIRTEIAQTSQESFACQMCMTQSNLSRVYPSCFLLYRLHLTYRINLNWLLTGQGEVLIH